jgi:hypothetical protein
LDVYNGQQPPVSNLNASPKLPEGMERVRRHRNSVTESVVELDTAESAYFNENISKITDQIYLGTYFVAQKLALLRNRLGKNILLLSYIYTL